MPAYQQTARHSFHQAHRASHRERHDAEPTMLRNPRWNAIRSAFQAGFSAADVTYMLDLSEEELRDYFRHQREATR